jgi:PAS domain-containing protein
MKALIAVGVVSLAKNGSEQAIKKLARWLLRPHLTPAVVPDALQRPQELNMQLATAYQLADESLQGRHISPVMSAYDPKRTCSKIAVWAMVVEPPFHWRPILASQVARFGSLGSTVQNKVELQTEHGSPETGTAFEDTELLANLLSLSYEPMFAWRLDGAIRFWNAGAERLYGFAPDEAVGRTSRSLLQTEFPIELTELRSRLRE